jgi:hypothetical protein
VVEETDPSSQGEKLDFFYKGSVFSAVVDEAVAAFIYS